MDRTLQEIQEKIDKGKSISDEEVEFLHADAEETQLDKRMIEQEPEDAS